MPRTKVDRKNSKLGGLIYHLRQVIDLHRIIGLNARALKKRGLGGAFFGMVQGLAHASIVLTISKIFDTESAYELYSINGVLLRLQNTQFSDVQTQAITRFGQKFGNETLDPDTWTNLVLTVEIFTAQHLSALKDLRRYRDKVLAHPELGFNLRTVNTSHNDYEAIFEFANEFYRLVHDSVVGVGPALMSMTVGPSLARLIKEIGITEPERYFRR